ncbi:MAG TPA: ADP-ribosylglycohydrolase family protein [Fimbriimonadaceae bacterium]|nr:ADP-ribosylglycohydrolase family protein [Fimbriimonadaceae bacterium]
MSKEREAFLIDRAKACLLAGALGDALGAPVEFMSIDEIEKRYGPEGIQDFDIAYGRLGAITDDTQMTLFTAEGLIRAWVRGTLRGVCHPPGVVGYAYQRWMHTQGERVNPYVLEEGHRGWLIEIRELFSRRAPGNTCLAALRIWNQEPAKNDSKGCGSVMRSAPFGFFPDSANLARECSEITHGHPEAGASSAVLADTISRILQGERLHWALRSAVEKHASGTRTEALIRRALEAHESDSGVRDTISTLGAGWVAEEALAIGAYCAVHAEGDLAQGLRWAVNHNGDSDSTGSICGNLMGASLGMEALPDRWLAELELRREIEQVAEDMVGVQTEDPERFWDRYPGV